MGAGTAEGPRRIPGPRRPPVRKGYYGFSLADFMGYAMTVISAVEHLNIDSDFDKWQVSLDGFDSVSGRYSVSLRWFEKPAKSTRKAEETKASYVICPCKHGKMTSFFCRKEITPPGRKFGDRLPDEVIIHALRPAGPLYLVFGCWAITGGFFYARLCFCSLFELC